MNNTLCDVPNISPASSPIAQELLLKFNNTGILSDDIKNLRSVV